MKIRIVVLSLFMLAAAAVISYASRPEIIPLRHSLDGLPMHIADWNGQRTPDMDQKTLNVLGVDDYIKRVYYRGDSIPVSLYIGYYESQKTGATIHSPMNCMPGSGWLPVKNEHMPISLSGGDIIEVNRITIEKSGASQVVLYWYQSQGRVVASEYMGKIYTVIDALRNHRTDAALVRIVVPVADSARLQTDAEATAEKAAIEFTQDLFPLLADYLPD